MKWISILGCAAAIAVAQVAPAQPSLESGTVVQAAERLKAGEFLWAPQVAPQGPVLLIVSLATQRAVLYRNGVPIAITTVSTGRPGHTTPTGVFTILQRRVEHYSNLYNNAPMPYMQRLTWGGVALHGGHLPGYPASHGCIRLPHEFARLLYTVTHMGMTVVVTEDATVPRIAPAETLLRGNSGNSASGNADVQWQPERSPSGPLSIVVSASDQRVLVLRNGVLIGSAPVEIAGPITRTSAFVLSRADGRERVWVRIGLPGQAADDDPLEDLRGRIGVPEAFRRQVEAVLRPGTTVVVTGDSLAAGAMGQGTAVIEGNQMEPR